MKAWCVKWREPVMFDADAWTYAEGWCAIKGNYRPKDSEVDHVPTECDHVITLAGQFDERVPTCPECLKALKGGK